jgi:SAM domain (Sterile alpha motif)
VQEIVDWLEKLGMSEYARGFAENDIDFTILGELTDQTLKRSASHRLAIAESRCAQLPISKASKS